MIPHLVEIHEKYSEAGLTILALSDEAQATLQKFVADKKIPYLVGYQDRSEYGVSGIPDGYLIGPDGTVVWQGNPHSLREQQIVDELQKVRLAPDLPWTKNLKSIVKDVEKKKLGKAVQSLEKLLAKTDDETDRTQAQTLLDYLTAKATDGRSKADRLAAGGDYHKAVAALEVLADEFDGLPLADEASDLVKTWKKDKAIESQIDAGVLYETGLQLKAAGHAKEAAASFAKAAKKAEGTPIGEKALAELRALDE